jgi:hypothetical protein
MGVSILEPVQEPQTLQTRLASANVLAESAMTTIHSAIRDLDHAAAIQDEIAGELYAEVEALERNVSSTAQLAQDVLRESINNASTAKRAREFIATI